MCLHIASLLLSRCIWATLKLCRCNRGDELAELRKRANWCRPSKSTRCSMDTRLVNKHTIPALTMMRHTEINRVQDLPKDVILGTQRLKQSRHDILVGSCECLDILKNLRGRRSQPNHESMSTSPPCLAKKRIKNAKHRYQEHAWVLRHEGKYSSFGLLPKHVLHRFEAQCATSIKSSLPPPCLAVKSTHNITVYYAILKICNNKLICWIGLRALAPFDKIH